MDDSISFSQEAFDMLMSAKVSLTQRKQFIKHLLNISYVDSILKGIIFKPAHNEVLQAVIKEKGEFSTALELYQPHRWKLEDLIIIYHTSKDKSHFVVLAIALKNETILDEVYRAYKGTNNAKINHLQVLYTDPTIKIDLGCLKYFGKFV